MDKDFFNDDNMIDNNTENNANDITNDMEETREDFLFNEDETTDSAVILDPPEISYTSIFDEESNYYVPPIIKPKKKKNRFKFAKASAIILIVGATFASGFAVGNHNRDLPQTTTLQATIDQPLILTSSVNNQAMPATEVFKALSNAVVNINTKTSVEGSYFYGTFGEAEGAGSGVIIHEDNDKIYIVTNAHVVTGASQCTISIDGVKTAIANPVGKSAENDIAVISVKKSDLVAAGITDYKIASFANSDNLVVAEDVMAIGNAVGEGKSATKGIISAIEKQINIDGRKLDVIQTDAAINPGNSGGALVNMNASVIGINTAKYASYYGSAESVEGMGYAIPSNTVKRLVEEIITTGSTSGETSSNRPYLGIKGGTITQELQVTNNLPAGFGVSEVNQGTNIARSGLRAGDIITKYNGQRIMSIEELTTSLESSKVGDKVTIEVYRQGKYITFDVVLQDYSSTHGF